jgi:hypothetical protein
MHLRLLTRKLSDKILVLAGLLACFTVIAFPFYQWQLDNSFLEAHSYGDSIGL